MTAVQFDKYDLKVEDRQGSRFIFDEFRKKWVVLTPEEWVRQHILHYLVKQLNYPKSLIAVERGIELNGLKKRFDVVVFNKAGEPKMIIECKAPEETLNEKVFQQIANYNLALRVDYLWVSNGTYNFCCKLRLPLQLVGAIPDYSTLTGV